MTAATGDSLSFGYDALKRLNRVTVKNGSSVILNTAYAYRDVSWNRGSAQVEFRNVRLGSDSGMLLEGKKYVYDDVGNLKEIRESTDDFSKLVEYAYDSQNQLTSEAYYKSGEAKAYLTYYYTYDTAGNLLTVSQKKGNTTTLLQTYTYGDAQWHDLLTAVNGQAITYDASGNPLSYGGWSFGWQNGRQLKTASKTSDGKTETLEYAYDADGIRTSKTYTVETFTQVPDYTVTFQADGATVKTMTVEDGYTLKDSDYPAVPTKTGYTGEWVKYTSAVHSNVTVQAKYTAVVAKYTVTFKADNTVVKTMTVKDGYTLKASDYPTVPAKSGYKGSWKRYTAAIHSDITIDAVYEPVIVTKQYTVVFRADAKVLKTMKVEVGYTLQDSDYPEIPAKEGYTGHWDKSTTRIIKNTIINVIYSDNSSHVVTFIFDGAQIGTLTVTDGYVLKNSDYPSPFAPVGYIVTWEKYTLPIHSDITVTGKLQSDVTIPPQPTSPGEIMSGGEGEPVEADVPAEDETVAPQEMHVTGTQTVTHEYLTLNGKVARETIRTNNTLTAVLDFVYDESGKPFALKYSTNGTSFQTYYYVLNLQGDVVKLIHYIPGFEYESVATYEYDAWGNVSGSGKLAEINPLRYRGYYYDNETGFYYLQSRYYDPANRRFINADLLASTGQGFTGTNMFAYCVNSPVVLGDYEGTDAILIIDEDAVHGNGHVCFMVQNNEGAWNYYSFGPGRPAWFTGAACLFGGYVKGVIYRSKLGTADGFDLTTFSGCADFMKTDATANGFANSASKKMDDVIYLTGDFSKSFEAADSLYTRQEETLLGKIFPIQYNLLDYNCMHFALDMLSKSSNAFTREQNKTLKRLKRWSVVPNNNIKDMAGLGVYLN